jgi:hypothetical protein
MNKSNDLLDRVRYDLQRLAEFLDYPGGDLSKVPDKNRELLGYYTLRDGEYRDNQEAWEACQQLRLAERGMVRGEIDVCKEADILLHKNGKEWTIVISDRTLFSLFPPSLAPAHATELEKAIAYLGEIKIEDCRPFKGGISDFLSKRWNGLIQIGDDQFLTWGIGYNPFKRIAVKEQKPVQYSTLYDAWHVLKTEHIKEIIGQGQEPKREAKCYLDCKKQCGYCFPPLSDSGMIEKGAAEKLSDFLFNNFHTKKERAYCVHSVYGRDISTDTRYKLIKLEPGTYRNAVHGLKAMKEAYNRN